MKLMPFLFFFASKSILRMKLDFGDPEHGVAVLFDKFVRISAGLLKINNEFCGNFVVHFFAFHHKSRAIVSICGANQYEFR